MKPFPILVLLSSVLTLAAWQPASGQTGTPAPGGRSGSTPGAGAGAGTGTDQSGEGVAKGVITPPADVDPGIHRAPPAVEFPTRVIPPPGTPGGDPKVQPK